jgi:hypothetical protein
MGALAGWILPAVLIPRPHEFDFLAILGWRVVLVPFGAILGFIVGWAAGRTPPAEELQAEANTPLNVDPVDR